MDALVAAGVEAARARGAAPGDPVRVVLVPTAAARNRPPAAVEYGRRAFEAAGQRTGVQLEITAAYVVDAASAADPSMAGTLAAADVIHLPGGDPDLIPAILRGSQAWDAMLAAHRRGACLAGASAGAMALAARCWTPAGLVDGLGLVPGIAVLPHFAPGRIARWRGTTGGPDDAITWLGLDERTMLIGRPGSAWQVAGAGRAHLVPPGADAPTATAGHGEALTLPERAPG
jgi:cyanophycinase-like exopeptidase